MNNDVGRTSQDLPYFVPSEDSHHNLFDTSMRGQELVEFALLLPLLLLLIFGIIDFGIAVFRYNTVANVGREVARRGVVGPNQDALDAFLFTDDYDPGDPDTKAYSQDILRWATGLIPDTETLDISYSLANEGLISSTVQVTVTYAHEFLTGPIILAVGGRPTVTLRSVSTMYTETPATPYP